MALDRGPSIVIRQPGAGAVAGASGQGKGEGGSASPGAADASPAAPGYSPTPAAAASRAAAAASRPVRTDPVDDDGETALGRAILSADLEHVAELVASGASLDQPHPDTGLTALMACCRLGLEAAAELLLSAGADVMVGDVDGRTALLHAIESRHDPIARALLAAGADVDASDASGETPLLAAIGVRLPSVVALLLGSGADIDGATPSGETPLMRAASLDQPAVVRDLIRRECDVSARDMRGDKAFDIAVAAGAFVCAGIVLRADPVQRADSLAVARRAGMDVDGTTEPTGGDGERLPGRRTSRGAGVGSMARAASKAVSLATEVDADGPQLEFDMSFGLPADVMRFVRQHGLQACADRLANVDAVRSAADLPRLGRRVLVRAGLSHDEVKRFEAAVNARLRAELRARFSVHAADPPRSDSLQAVRAAVRSCEWSACAKCCLCCCMGGSMAAPGFGDGVEERAVSMATSKERSNYRRTLLQQAEAAAYMRGETYEDVFYGEEGAEGEASGLGCLAIFCGCCGPEDEMSTGPCSRPTRTAVIAAGGTVGEGEGIEYHGSEAAGQRLGSTPLARDRQRMQRQAAAAGRARAAELEKRFPSEQRRRRSKRVTDADLARHLGVADEPGVRTFAAGRHIFSTDGHSVSEVDVPY